MTLREVRQALAEAIRDTFNITVYDEIPNAASFPCVALYPADPYITFEVIGDSLLRVRQDINIVCMVSDVDNKGSLDAIEKLLINTTIALPAHVELSDWSKPVQDTLGSNPILQSQMTVKVRSTQEPQ